ncbi:O-acyltransferase [Sporobolomyces salmoneus]|uniref:O-acyltransferase n=1 Tax=Sporobolomyces salmoneus TaxID=183962 RepID=UPI003172D5FB
MQQLEQDHDRLDSPTPQSLPNRSKWSITNLTVSIPPSLSRPTSTSPSSNTVTSRWRTREFYVYYAVFLVVVPQMYWSPVKVSSDKHPLYWVYQHKLDDGWLFGWKVDNSDHQYHLFRSHLPLLALLFILYLSLSHFSRRLLNRTSRPARSRFILLFSLVMLSIFHGTSLLKMLLILYVNWRLARLALNEQNEKNLIKREWVPYVTWGFNGAILFLNEMYGGYSFGSILSALSWLDDYKGLLPRWQIMWNISMLRIISFNMELYWSTSANPAPSTKHLPPPASADESDNYSFPLFLSYVLYPPLYLAGPIISYPSFLSQLSPPPPPPQQTVSTIDETSPSSILRYSFRFLSSLLTMEIILHTMYVVAIKDSGIDWWTNLGPMQVSMIGFWNLIIVWLKLLIPWRFFRLVALMDGIDPPENMIRCMANNYSTLGFWRSWHRSYNLWIIRYLYVPIGGSKRPVIATLVVFTFVALWHDLSMKLLAWGWIVSVFVLPEMVATSLVPYKKFGDQWWYRHLAAIGGVFNVLLMMTANLVGFVVGIDGAKALWSKMLGTTEGRIFMVVASACLFVAIQVMFEYREEERRKGINRRC